MKRLVRNSGRAGRSLLQAVPTILVIVTLGFVMLELAPGDAADFMAADVDAATEQSVADLRHRFGLDLPVLDRLTRYYGTLAHFSLGTSPRYGLPVADLILERIPSTLALMSTAVAVAIILGIVSGAFMAMTQGRWPDRVLSVLSLLFYSVPSFWIGLMLIILFSVHLGWLPSGGARARSGDRAAAWPGWPTGCVTLPCPPPRWVSTTWRSMPG